MSSLAFEAISLLRELREEFTDAEFGLRIQALFAHTLLALGAHILDIKSQGHPDLIADMGIQTWKLEVEVIGQTPYQIDKDDLKGIYPSGSEWQGFLALLDSGPPICWFLLSHKVLEGRKSLYITQMQRLSDASLSSSIGEKFALLVIRNKHRLKNLTFSLLKEWAVEGRGI